MEATAGKNAGSSRTPPRHGGKAPAVPGYLRPSAGSCHHVCKYGGTHTFEEKEAHGGGRAHPRSSRRQLQPPVDPDSQRTAALAKVRSASSRRRAGDFSKLEKSSNVAVVGSKGRKVAAADAVEWKDIGAYDAAPAASASSPRPAKIVGGDGKKKDVIKGKKPCDKAKITHQVGVGAVTKTDGSVKKKPVKSVASKLTGKTSTQPDQSGEGATPPSEKKKMIKSRKCVKPPKVKKDIVVDRKGGGQEIVHGDDAAVAADDVKRGKSHHPIDQEDQYDTTAMAESGRPMVAAHRRPKSMSISSRSVRFPFTRQASKSSVTFKMRSKSGRVALAVPSEEEEKTVAPRLRLFRRGDAGSSSSSGNGLQLRIRSLRRRGGASGGAAAPEDAGEEEEPEAVQQRDRGDSEQACEGEEEQGEGIGWGL